MSAGNFDTRLNRRAAIGLGSGIVAGGLLAGAGSARAVVRHGGRLREQQGQLPVDQIQEALQAQGTVSSGVLSVDISRDDIGEVRGPLGVTFTPAFQIDGTLTFQPLGNGQAFFNGDLPLKPRETNPFIDAILDNGLVFQAFHQHYIEMDPPVWYIHWRGVGDAVELARRVHNAIKTTGTPLPQAPPASPHTPLDPQRLERILHGSAEVGEQGVVTVTVPRTDRIVIDGVVVSPEANISSNVQFKPSGISGDAWVGPDFSMTATEIPGVVKTMRAHDWFVGCLYNQETLEEPQLYFSHMLKQGDAYALAQEVRAGLALTKVD
jgi:hypothetical protein